MTGLGRPDDESKRFFSLLLLRSGIVVDFEVAEVWSEAEKRSISEFELYPESSAEEKAFFDDT